MTAAIANNPHSSLPRYCRGAGMNVGVGHPKEAASFVTSRVTIGDGALSAMLMLLVPSRNV